MTFEWTPMLCKSAAPEELEHYADGRWVAEPKLNGWRLFAAKLRDQVIVRAGRNGANYTGRLPLIEAALADSLPDATIADGEILCASGLEALGSAMRTERPYRKDDLQLVVFDLLMADGEDLRGRSWEERRERLDGLAGGPSAPFPTARVRSSLLLPVSAETLAAVLDAGCEGLVLKHRASRYVHKRSPMWRKVKPQNTIDARVIGFKPGKGSLKGKVGALEFEVVGGQFDGQRSSCRGFDMALCEQITAHPDDWLEAMIEVKVFDSDGVLRSPQFLRRRYDLERAA